MTDSELVAAIARIIRTRPRVKKVDRRSAEAVDLARYDQIVGLIARHQSARKVAQSVAEVATLPATPDEGTR